MPYLAIPRLQDQPLLLLVAVLNPPLLQLSQSTIPCEKTQELAELSPTSSLTPSITESRQEQKIYLLQILNRAILRFLLSSAAEKTIHLSPSWFLFRKQYQTSSIFYSSSKQGITDQLHSHPQGSLTSKIVSAPSLAQCKYLTHLKYLKSLEGQDHDC